MKATASDYASWIFAIFAAVQLFACAGREAVWQRDPASRAVSAATRDEAERLALSASPLWQERLERSKLEEMIALLGRATDLDPNQPASFARLARALYFLADGHLWFDLERAKRHDESGESADAAKVKRAMLAAYKRGTDAAERALTAHSPKFASAMRAGARLETALNLVTTPAAADALFWYAANLGRWALLSGLGEILYHKDRVYAVVAHVQSLAPDYFYGATDRYFGVYYTRVPVPRGDLPRARRHFERALRKHPGYLATRVLFAEHYAVRTRDRALFEKELRAVLSSDERALGDVVPELTVEKRRARLLLERAEDLF